MADASVYTADISHFMPEMVWSLRLLQCCAGLGEALVELGLGDLGSKEGFPLASVKSLFATWLLAQTCSTFLATARAACPMGMIYRKGLCCIQELLKHKSGV